MWNAYFRSAGGCEFRKQCAACSSSSADLADKPGTSAAVELRLESGDGDRILAGTGK